MGYGGASFAPVTFDGEQAPPPDITAGKYRFQIVAIEVMATKVKKDGDVPHPMLVVTSRALKVLKAYGKGAALKKAEKAAIESVGGEVSDFVTFFSESDRKGRMGKQRFRSYCDITESPYTIVPKQITEEADFDDVKTAWTDKKFDGYITLRDDAEGNPRASINLVEPKALRDLDEGMGEVSDDEPDAADEDEDEGGTPANLAATPDTADEDEDEDEEPEEPPVAVVTKAKKGAVTQPATPAAGKKSKK